MGEALRPVFFHAAEARLDAAPAGLWAGQSITPGKHHSTGRSCSLQLGFVYLQKSSVLSEKYSILFTSMSTVNKLTRDHY